MLPVDLRILCLELVVLLVQKGCLLLMKLWEGVLLVLTKPLIDIAVPVSHISHEVQDPVLLHREREP